MDERPGTEELYRLVVDVLRSAIPGSPPLQTETELLESGLLDSLAIVSVVDQIESEAQVLMPSELLVPASFETPAALATAVAAAVEQATQAPFGSPQ